MVGVSPRLVLAVSVTLVSMSASSYGMEWSSWGSWSSCSDRCGDGSQLRKRQCNSDPSDGDEACFGISVQSRDCVCEKEFNTREDCQRCQLVTKVSGYIADPCSCRIFHQCVKYGGTWMSYLQRCPGCQHWSQEALTCVKPSDECYYDDDEENPEQSVATVAPVVFEGDTCSKDGMKRRSVERPPGSYVWVLDDGREYTMPCAPGTDFQFEACDCIKTEGPGPAPVDRTMPMVCMDFDTNWGNWGFNSAKWIWITNSNVKQVSAGCLKGNCADFNGNAYLSIDRFNNAYAALGEFAVSLWFKARLQLPMQGLVSNGDCLQSSSLEIYLNSNQANASIQTDVNSAEIKTLVRIGYWEHLVMSYDGTKLDLYLNGNLVQSSAVTGKLQEKQCPLMFGYKWNKNFFLGRMDEICVYDKAVSKRYAQNLYNSIKDVDKRRANDHVHLTSR